MSLNVLSKQCLAQIHKRPTEAEATLNGEAWGLSSFPLEPG